MGRKPKFTVAGMFLVVALAGCQQPQPTPRPTSPAPARWTNNSGTSNNTAVPNNQNLSPYANTNNKQTNQTANPQTGFLSPTSAQQPQPGGFGNTNAGMAADSSQQRFTTPYANQFNGAGSMIPANSPQLPDTMAPSFGGTNNTPTIQPPPNTTQPNFGPTAAPVPPNPPSFGNPGGYSQPGYPIGETK
jgi:hypothetical protein